MAGNKGAANWKVVEATATTTTASADWSTNEIKLLINDGSVPILFTFDNGTQFTLRNGEEYLSESSSTGPMGGDTEPFSATVHFDATLELNAGDYIEVVAMADGAAGVVKLRPGESRIIAELVK